MKVVTKIIISLFISTCSMMLFGQGSTGLSKSITVNPFVDGTLLIPSEDEVTPLVIIIPDTGPTDRDGSQNFQKSNSLKKLAESLERYNIASFRYDKRILKQIKKGFVDPNISFDDLVSDAIDVVKYFKGSDKFSRIYIVGHGQGSLVGMLAAKNNVDGFISLAGSAKTIDRVIIEQVAQMDTALVNDTELAFAEMREGRLTKNYPGALETIFSSDTQPFIMSWMTYDPLKVIGELSIPSLIISGTKDLQVTIEESRSLNEKATNGTLRLIENMNHVLFIIEGDELENSKSYNESFRPIAEDIGKYISEFITAD